MKIVNTTRTTVIASNIEIADSFSSRSKGLLGRRSIEQGYALVIRPCNSIHMFFMHFSIDVIFVDKSNKVVGLIKDIKPFRLSPIYFKAWQAIELAAGTIDLTNTQISDILTFQP